MQEEDKLCQFPDFSKTKILEIWIHSFILLTLPFLIARLGIPSLDMVKKLPNGINADFQGHVFMGCKLLTVLISEVKRIALLKQLCHNFVADSDQTLNNLYERSFPGTLDNEVTGRSLAGKENMPFRAQCLHLTMVEGVGVLDNSCHLFLKKRGGWICSLTFILRSRQKKASPAHIYLILKLKTAPNKQKEPAKGLAQDYLLFSLDPLFRQLGVDLNYKSSAGTVALNGNTVWIDGKSILNLQKPKKPPNKTAAGAAALCTSELE